MARILPVAKLFVAILLLAIAAVMGADASSSLFKQAHARSGKTDTSAMTLKRVVLAHRHGARTPVMNVNGSCDVLGCGTLTNQGALMLHSLGEACRARYGAVLPSTYHARHIKSMSDESTRVIQSASAFLEGLFAYNATERIYPAIDTVDAFLIDPWSQPGPALHTITMGENSIANLTEKILAFLPRAQVVAIGKEIGLSEIECDLVPQVCIGEATDFLNSMNAAGRLSEYPVGAQYLPELNRAALMLFQTLNFGYDLFMANTTYFAEAGWPGAAIFNSMLGAAQNGPALTEFSGHDTTLMPLYSAMGNLTWAYPDFATALILEVYEGSSASSTSGSDLTVVPIVATTVQTPGTHPYTFTPYAATCMSETGAVYVAESCPLADLQRFAATRVGTAGSLVPGGCYAWPRDLADTLCTGDAKADAHLPCGKYRAACPFYGCGLGKFMTPDLACHAVPNATASRAL